MTSRTGLRAAAAALLVLGLAAATAAATYAARTGDGSKGDDSQRIVMRDDCDPRDPNWNQVGGCDRKKGNVTFAEFNALANSSLSQSVVGHQAWRNDPSYLVVQHGTTLRVKNAGGREHTFTKVAEFGGGLVPPLTRGLTLAPECPFSIGVLPGDSTRVSGLSVGNHLFMCCFHPWMRAMVKVKPRSGGHDDDDHDHHTDH